jgi:hypothetical protein
MAMLFKPFLIDFICLSSMVCVGNGTKVSCALINRIG